MIGPAGFMAGPQDWPRAEPTQDCEQCVHCVTINDDRDNYCTLQKRVVREVCVKFEHWEGSESNG